MCSGTRTEPAASAPVSARATRERSSLVLTITPLWPRTSLRPVAEGATEALTAGWSTSLLTRSREFAHRRVRVVRLQGDVAVDGASEEAACGAREDRSLAAGADGLFGEARGVDRQARVAPRYVPRARAVVHRHRRVRARGQLALELRRGGALAEAAHGHAADTHAVRDLIAARVVVYVHRQHQHREHAQHAGDEQHGGAAGAAQMGGAHRVHRLLRRLRARQRLHRARGLRSSHDSIV